ncbi:hypothetical protein B0H13DRAFT_1969655 [Mycena leptocephala]|nr:hypothetical protein B0H13DRAFT_1969655 [Mycena leptocephala]
MLQIPTSALSLFSFSSKGLVGLFGGFFIGAQVTLNMISLCDSNHRNHPMPTKCVPSNGTINFPYVAAMGYAIVIFASLFSILRAKGFQALPDGGPPSPDDPSLMTRRYPTALFHLHAIISAQVPSHHRLARPRFKFKLSQRPTTESVDVGLADSHFARARRRTRGIVAFARQILSAIERFFRDQWIAAGSWISGVKIYISQNGRQLSKILLLALASHFAAQLDPLDDILLGWYDRALPSVREINEIILHFSSYLSSLAASHFVELSTIFGVIVIHTSAMCIQIISLTVFGFPSTAWALLEELLEAEPFGILMFYACMTAYLCLALPVAPLVHSYRNLDSDRKQLLWRSFSCQQSRDRVRAAFWRLVKHHRSWKSIQIHDFHELTSGLPSTAVMLKASLETWCTLPLIQQFLIVAPAVIFYGYVYIVPMTRRLQLPYGPLPVLSPRSHLFVLQIPSLFFHLTDSVENRLAARRTTT